MHVIIVDLCICARNPSDHVMQNDITLLVGKCAHATCGNDVIIDKSSVFQDVKRMLCTRLDKNLFIYKISSSMVLWLASSVF